MALRVIERNLKAQNQEEKQKKPHNIYSFFQMSRVGLGKLKALIFECLLLQILNFPLGFPSEYYLSSLFATF